ncbi:hypothetical protein ACLQ2Q_15685 [Microbacterium sp. DT81.1]|uniref:hypothetical protein n=1 Tax=Microbacterium sp. DT81.1 TaxID=3393413 RepID=UPI003CE99C6C
MADPLTLSVIAALLVGKVFEKSLDKAASGIVDGAANAGDRLVTWLRSKLGPSSELKLVEEAPDSKRASDRLAEVIEAEIVDPEDIDELRRLVDQVQAQDPGVYQSAIGHHIVQASNSTVNLNGSGWDK